ncbi:thiamine phosphate synthase [Bacillus sp. REN10]|uniref:thiamine phosphate synthase n=1 Tax=Bacillus sp. REN10 TaxID=2782541 RepID=UPI00193B4226|nr:thiamine phosphate synthase [Bacillus sp. REN10]
MAQLRQQLKVYFIMGTANSKMPLLETLKEAIKGGITMFQFREKGDRALIGEEKLQLAKELQAICRQHNIPFIVNDDIDLAIQLNADGVHIGQDDEKVAVVRKKFPNKIIGVSAHTIEEVEAAIKDGADYLGIGPVFPTNTKADAKEVQGTKLIEEIRAKGLAIPIVGIGGITAENAAAVIRAGADGVSVITAISRHSSPAIAAQQLSLAVRNR